MTYTEYRKSFKTVEEFRRSFGKLSAEEVQSLIANENTSGMIKGCIMTTWRQCVEEAKKIKSRS